VSKNLTKKQKTLIKDSFNEDFNNLVENPYMENVLWNLCWQFREELRNLINSNQINVDRNFCKKRITMFDTILQGNYFFKNKEVSDE